MWSLETRHEWCAGAHSAARDCVGGGKGRHPDCSGAGSWRCFAGSTPRQAKCVRCHFGLLGSPAAASAFLATPPKDAGGPAVLEQLSFDAEHRSIEELAPQVVARYILHHKAVPGCQDYAYRPPGPAWLLWPEFPPRLHEACGAQV